MFYHGTIRKRLVLENIVIDVRAGME